MDVQYGITTEDRPPVATTVAGPTSFWIRSITPSTSAAVPKTSPAWMASTVFFPMTDRGAAISTWGRRSAARESASAETSRPGAITPPRNSPFSEMTS